LGIFSSLGGKVNSLAASKKIDFPQKGLGNASMLDKKTTVNAAQAGDSPDQFHQFM